MRYLRSRRTDVLPTTAAPGSSSPAKQMPRGAEPADAAPQSVMLRVFHALSLLTQLGGLGAALVNVLLLVFALPAAGADASWLVFALRCYGGALGVVVAVVEAEPPAVMRLVSFLDSWVLRGAFISFVGVVLAAEEPPDSPAMAALAQGIGLYLVATGLVYATLGMLCFQRLRQWQLGKLRRKKMLRSEVEELAEKKVEIERLMADTERKLGQLA